MTRPDARPSSQPSPGVPGERELRARLWKLQSVAAPYLFVAPFVLLFCGFFLYPLGRSLWLAFHKTVGPQREILVGFDNFRFLLQDKLFHLAVFNTLVYAVLFVLLQIPLALGLAILLNDRRVIGRSIFRFAFFSTHLVGGVYVAILFSQVLSRNGLLNRVLSGLLLGDVRVDWLGEKYLTIVVLLMAGLWLSVGWAMIYFLAALQSVDRELYEAAEVDGAGPWSRFWHVTLPGIKPVMAFMALVGLIGAFQLFELPYVLYGQSAGPVNSGLTIVMHQFVTGIGTRDLGYASAIGWALVLLVTGVALAARIVPGLGRGK
jgi:ABC-type sugar transport system permease subunit